VRFHSDKRINRTAAGCYSFQLMLCMKQEVRFNDRKANTTLKMYKCVMQLFRKLPHMSKLASFVASSFVKSIIIPYVSEILGCIILP
jgi:hypothetical protein